MMNNFFNKKVLKVWLVFLLSLMICIIFYSKLPQEIPNQFDLNGDIQSYDNKRIIFMFPGLIVFVVLISTIARLIDPKRKNYDIFENEFYAFQFVFSLFMVLIQGIIIAYSMKWINQTMSFMNLGLGLLFIFLGNILPKLKYNYSMGIKTPWTLADERVWYLTHRLCGKIWVSIGLLMVVITIIPQPYQKILFIFMLVIGTLGTYIISYYYFQKLHNNTIND